MFSEEKLDNPVWNSLSEEHKNLAIEYENIKFYHPDYCPFGAFEVTENISKGIDTYSAISDDFFIVGTQPPVFSNKLKLKDELDCLQMIVRKKIDKTVLETVVQLTEEHSTELFQLVNWVFPGYFRKKTALLGNYYGIFQKDQLVAVTGERMRTFECVEVSAVVTHPDYTGRGYASQLVTYTANAIFDQGKIPFLHVAENNGRAIKLYEKLGFSIRRKIHLWNLTV